MRLVFALLCIPFCLHANEESENEWINELHLQSQTNSTVLIEDGVEQSKAKRIKVGLGIGRGAALLQDEQHIIEHAGHYKSRGATDVGIKLSFSLG